MSRIINQNGQEKKDCWLVVSLRSGDDAILVGKLRQRRCGATREWAIWFECWNKLRDHKLFESWSKKLVVSGEKSIVTSSALIPVDEQTVLIEIISFLFLKLSILIKKDVGHGAAAHLCPHQHSDACRNNSALSVCGCPNKGCFKPPRIIDINLKSQWAKKAKKQNIKNNQEEYHWTQFRRWHRAIYILNIANQNY